MHHFPKNIHVSWARGQNLGHLVFFFRIICIWATVAISTRWAFAGTLSWSLLVMCKVWHKYNESAHIVELAMSLSLLTWGFIPPTVGLEVIILETFQKSYSVFPTYADIFPNIYKKTFIFRHLVSYSWKASSHQLQSLASIPQGGARGKNLGHLFFF